MKFYIELIKLRVKNFINDNWNSGRLFDKGKIIFIGLVTLFIFIKIIYSIF